MTCLCSFHSICSMCACSTMIDRLQCQVFTFQLCSYFVYFGKTLYLNLLQSTQLYRECSLEHLLEGYFFLVYEVIGEISI